jgi:hypothetical protein
LIGAHTMCGLFLLIIYSLIVTSDELETRRRRA